MKKSSKKRWWLNTKPLYKEFGESKFKRVKRSETIRPSDRIERLLKKEYAKS